MKRRSDHLAPPSEKKTAAKSANPEALTLRAMFSAASFYDVIHAGPSTDAAAGEPDEQLGQPAIVAFYGFRGGAGRTMGLAHTAVSIAEKKHRVVAIDLDLEAPGLHAVMGAPNTDQDHGSLRLLRDALIAKPDETLSVTAHVVVRDFPTGARVHIIPAGPLCDRYLAGLEELNVSLWNQREDMGPLTRMIGAVTTDLHPDIVLLDCRTGLSGMSASALFHTADLVVCFVPLSLQVLDGLGVLLDAAVAAKARRNNRPALLLVPSMVPEGVEGRRKLEEMLPRFEEMYLRRVRRVQPESEDDFDVLERMTVPILREGIEYQRGLALTGRVDEVYMQRAREQYRTLTEHIVGLCGLARRPDSVGTVERLDAAGVLNELEIPKGIAFAEEVDPNDLVKLFVKPTDFENLRDRATAFVVGAKGTGKTWLWRYLVHGGGRVDGEPDMLYLAGHEPTDKDAQYSPTATINRITSSGFREIEKGARMRQHNSYRAFWHLYALARLVRRFPKLADAALSVADRHERKKVDALFSSSERAFNKVMINLLSEPYVGTLTEAMTVAVDKATLDEDALVTLLYDGLETSFEGETRHRFVSGLVEMVYSLRGVLRRIFFKIFLREDVYYGLDIQNQSHLDAAKLELRWTAVDLWRIALNIVQKSPIYMGIVGELKPGAASPWDYSEEELRRLLNPLWGAQLEAGNKISTANFILNRTSDGKGRLFPRTLVQLLAGAVEEEKAKGDSRKDRVLRSASIQSGFEQASKQRLGDLRKEYKELGQYLEALNGMKPTATAEELAGLFRSKFRGKKQKPGAEAGTLHAGPRGWSGVIERLREVGVLAEYRRATGDKGEPKFQVALLYRPAIGIKMFGV